MGGRLAVRLWLLCFYVGVTAASTSCDRGNVSEKKYLLYDVNPGEGFNLRRDVYMRMALLARRLRNQGDWILVLPPWGPLPHWRSNDVGDQTGLPWRRFFDVESLNRFTPVVELRDLGAKTPTMDRVMRLRAFDEVPSGRWEEKHRIVECAGHATRTCDADVDGVSHCRFWGWHQVKARRVQCVQFQGHAKRLVSLLTEAAAESEPQRFFLIDRAEVALHDDYGSADYWRVRRSMRFASELLAVAAEFRRRRLNSEDAVDGTTLAADWRDDQQQRRRSPVSSKGGPYVCGHLRRQDFLRGRAADIPSLAAAAQHLKRITDQLDLKVVFVASDGTDTELEELGEYFAAPYKMEVFRPDPETRRRLQDGGAAAVEQIICSRARHFIGSHESTFSLRIHEEREILGFPPESTFNRFCYDGQTDCEQPARWRIVF